jgi:hypothetical protein
VNSPGYGRGALRYRDEDLLLIAALLIVLFLVVLPVVLGLIYRKRKVAEDAAHDARLRAMTQTYLAAARKKKAAEAAAANAAAVAAATVSSSSSQPVESAPPGPPRDERECPFCAEPILKKARVCKHCQRDVEPVAG